jgi:hypothetical protein
MLLLFFGPAPELIPHHHINRISTPSPQLKSINNKQKAITLHSSKRSCRKKSHCHVKNTNSNNDPVLTTITEEPSWQSSASSLSNVSYRDGNISDSSVSHSSKKFAMPRVHHNNLQQKDNLNQSDGITIEANQPAFKSIIVQPEVTVETTNCGNQQNTKVTATANIKLEFTTGSGTTTSSTNATMSS